MSNENSQPSNQNSNTNNKPPVDRRPQGTIVNENFTRDSSNKSDSPKKP